MADGKVIIGTQIDESGLNKGIRNVEDSLGKLKGTIVKLGIGTAVFAGLKKAVTGFSEFQTGLTKATTLFGDVEVDMENLEKKMMSLSTASGIATDALNEGLYQALSAGVPVTEDMAEATQFLEEASKLAVAGFTDLPTAIDATSKTLNAYGLGVEEAERIQNILIETQNRGITTVGELGTALSNVTPIAASFGVSFEEVGASLALLTAKGVPTAQATTQLRQAIAELGKDGTQAAKALEQAAKAEGWNATSFKEMMEEGKSLADVMDIMQKQADKTGVSVLDLFSSVEAGQAALAITSDLEKFNSNIEAMGDSAGAVELAYEKMDATVGRSLERIGTAFSNILTSMGASSEGIISDVVGFVEEAVTGIADAFGENGLQGAIMFMMDNLETQLPRIFNWGLELLENLANSLIQNIPKVAGVIYNAFTTLWKTAFDHRTEIFNIGVDLISSLWGGVSNAFSAFSRSLGEMFGIIKSIWKNIDWKELGIDLLNKIWEGIKSAFGWFGSMFERLGNWLVDKLEFWKKGEEEGEAFMDEFFESSEKTAIKSTDDLVYAITEGFDKVVGKSKKKGEEVGDAFVESLESPEFEKKVVDAITEPVIEGIELNKLAVEKSIQPVIKSLGEVKKAVKELDDTQQETFTNWCNGFDMMGSVSEDFFEAVAKGEDAWAVLAKSGLNAIASLVEALGHQLAANAALALIQKAYSDAAIAGAESMAAYAAAGLIRGWAGSFATGGIVRGAYTGGDNLTASVKAGEVILNHAQAINVARLLEAMEQSSKGGGGLVIAFNAPVYGDKEEIATMVYDKVKSLQHEGRLEAW